MNNNAQDKQQLPLAAAIEKQLSDEQLDAEQLRRLMAMQQSALAEPPAVSAHPWRRRYQAMAACGLLLVGVFLLWQNLGPARGDYSRHIALEVIDNHLKLKPLDVAAGSMDEVRDFFTQLDFSPLAPDLLESRFGLAQSSMLGGRYCSIKGVSAAQLRYQRGGGDLSTLYEVAYDPEVFGFVPSVDRGEAPRELLLKGLKVNLWVEKGLLMVLVTRA